MDMENFMDLDTVLACINIVLIIVAIFIASYESTKQDIEYYRMEIEHIQRCLEKIDPEK